MDLLVTSVETSSPRTKTAVMIGRDTGMSSGTVPKPKEGRTKLPTRFTDVYTESKDFYESLDPKSSRIFTLVEYE